MGNYLNTEYTVLNIANLNFLRFILSLLNMGLLKASTNRVRTSEALRMNSIWEKTIGLQHEHNNTAVEERLNKGLLAHVRGAKIKREHTSIRNSANKTINLGMKTTDLENFLGIIKHHN